MAQNNRLMPGYNMPVGEKIDVIIDHDGPTSYTNSGVFSTSGEVINASDFGLGGIEYILAESLSSDGLNFVRLTLTGQSDTNTSTLVGANAVTAARVHWFVQSSGAEVANAVDLSGKSIRLYIRGV